MTETVSSLMTAPVITAAPEDTIAEARLAMARAWIRHLPVVDDGRVVGILSDRDLRSADDGESVASSMTRDPHTVFRDTPARDAAALMIQYRIDALPVVDADMRLLGVVTSTDLLFVAHAALSDGEASPAPPESVEIEHAALRTHLERLVQARHPELAAEVMRELRNFLRRHFDREEAPGGFFERISVSAESHDLDRLRRDHRSILITALDLEHQLRAFVANGIHEVCSLDDFVRQIEDHEQREVAMFRRALSAASSARA
jgi:acetoin utilization protein AcuB